MQLFRKILVPVELGSEARPAIHQAERLARQNDASVDLFHVWQPPALMPSPLLFVPSEGGRALPASDVAQNLARARLQELADELRREGVHQVRCHVGLGDPAEEICQLVVKEGFDLVIMATHARGALSHAFLGSVTQKVLRHARCPVLVVSVDGRSGG